MTIPASGDETASAATLAELHKKVEMILEAIGTLPKIQETVDATFEEVGQLRTDMEVVKEALKEQAQRIEVLEQAAS